MSQRGGLGVQALRGVAWTTAERWVDKVIGVAVFAMLARILRPDDFGLVALVATFTGFSEIVASQGLGFAVVMRRDVGDRELNAAFWANTAFTMVVAVALGAVALVFRALGRTELALVLAGLTLAFSLNCLARIHAASMTRELQFRALAIRSMAADIAGGVVGVTFALKGAGAHSIVAQSIVTAALKLFGVWVGCAWQPKLQFSRAAFADVYSFGWKVCVDRIIVYFRDNLDVLFISALADMSTLGLYSVAKRVIDMLASLFVSVVTTVVYPVFSRAQEDVARLVSGFERAVGVTAVVLVPLFLGAAVMAPESLSLVVGPNWEGAGIIVRVMAVAAAISWLDPLIGAVMLAQQRPGTVLLVHVLGTITSAIVVVAGAPWGVIGVAVAVAVRRIVGTGLLLRYAKRIAPGMSLRRVFRQFTAPVAASAVMVVAVGAIKDLFPNVYWRIAISLALGICVYMTVLFVWWRATGASAMDDLLLLVRSRKRGAPMNAAAVDATLGESTATIVPEV